MKLLYIAYSQINLVDGNLASVCLWDDLVNIILVASIYKSMHLRMDIAV